MLPGCRSGDGIATHDPCRMVRTGMKNNVDDERQVVLEVENLFTQFHTDDGLIRAVDGLSFDLVEGETLGIVGESGCGKSITALSIMNMVPSPGGIESGRIVLYDHDGTPHEISKYSSKSRDMRSVRGRHVAMIFQEPMTSFTPVYTIGYQIREQLLEHEDLTKSQARERAIELLDFVGIANPKQRFDEYPYQFSGGMRQRAMIAMALSCNPRILIADEPTTALDVTIEAQILNLLRDIQERTNMAVILITHDMSVIAQMADRVMVMYMGMNVEAATCDSIFYSDYLHPYTEGLLNSIPVIGSEDELHPIAGSTPSPLNLPSGCRFHPRCPYAFEKCSQTDPDLYQIEERHSARCFLYDGEPFGRGEYIA